MKNLLLFWISITLLTCSNENKQKTIEQENWESFYIKFHKDSVFQISRIKFPLEGYGIYEDEGEIRWSRNNWKLLIGGIFDVDTSQYKTEYVKTDTLVTTRIYIPDSGFDVKEKYKLIDGKWYLVYFYDIVL